jgi:hypothetical protein
VPEDCICVLEFIDELSYEQDDSANILSKTRSSEICRSIFMRLIQSLSHRQQELPPHPSKLFLQKQPTCVTYNFEFGVLLRTFKPSHQTTSPPRRPCILPRFALESAAIGFLVDSTKYAKESGHWISRRADRSRIQPCVGRPTVYDQLYDDDVEYYRVKDVYVRYFPCTCCRILNL